MKITLLPERLVVKIKFAICLKHPENCAIISFLGKILDLKSEELSTNFESSK